MLAYNCLPPGLHPDTIAGLFLLADEARAARAADLTAALSAALARG